MKARIMLLILLSSLILGCRTKHKMVTTYKENKEETEKIKVDSLGLQNLKVVQNTSANTVSDEKKNEVSGEMLITGKSDAFNPFIFHNVVGSDTIQSISIIGNAEYLISNRFAKTDHKKSDARKEEVTNVVQETAQKSVSKEIVQKSASEVSEKTKEIKSNGFQAGAWIVIAVAVIILILTFFTYKYFKK
ncbi:hypothetical protein JI747_012030 [Chryseobacterium sp. RG1]|uniref:Lipoprotein n=1 Tax=Chryseobacterium tagetis TaxID=2801334 RepID=A0ABS8A3M4_9FLAO|nr:hypothetical protein [Chryseobacterium tagetis]MCA6067913.1 hypothetical protein [Chryseobacterium tagetis]